MLSSNQCSVFAVALLPSQLSPKPPQISTTTAFNRHHLQIDQISAPQPSRNFVRALRFAILRWRYGCLRRMDVSAYRPRWRSSTLQNGQENSLASGVTKNHTSKLITALRFISVTYAQHSVILEGGCSYCLHNMEDSSPRLMSRVYWL